MMDLYDKYAKNFSETRQSPWSGWKKLLTNSQIASTLNLQSCTLLDLGCGNGRFLKWLLQASGCKLQTLEYVGVDNSEEMLEIAKIETRDLRLETGREKVDESLKFIKQDLQQVGWDKKLGKQKFDLIVAFGLMHHLETFEVRKNLFTKVHNLLNKGGYFIVTFWQFAKYPKFLESHTIKEELKIENPKSENRKSKIKNFSDPISHVPYLTSPNDYFLSFGKEAVRFCHYCDDTEINDLIKVANFEIVDSFYSDGKEDKMNRYMILKKS